MMSKLWNDFARCLQEESGIGFGDLSLGDPWLGLVKARALYRGIASFSAFQWKVRITRDKKFNIST